MAKVFKQLEGGYNIVVQDHKGKLVAYYSPYGHPYLIVKKRVEDVDEAMRHFYAKVWKRRKVFYCTIHTEEGNSYAIKLMPGKGCDYSVKVMTGAETVEVFKVCLMKYQAENFFKDHAVEILEHCGIQLRGEQTFCFNFQTKQERKDANSAKCAEVALNIDTMLQCASLA